MGVCAIAEKTEPEEKKIKRFFPSPRSGRCCSVYDGDTLTIISLFYGNYYKFSVRIRGVDTPEINGKTLGERNAARRAKKFVEKMCLNQEIILKNHCREKYGRVCADIFVGHRSVANALISRKLGVPYFGGTKKKFCEFQ